MNTWTEAQLKLFERAMLPEEKVVESKPISPEAKQPHPFDEFTRKVFVRAFIGIGVILAMIAIFFVFSAVSTALAAPAAGMSIGSLILILMATNNR